MRTSALAALALLAFITIGCSSSGGGGDGGSSASQKCQALLSRTCDRALECVPSSYPSKDACLADASSAIDCGTAVSVTSNYEPCMSTMQSASCTELFPSGALVLPSICSQVIQVQSYEQP